MKLRRLPAVAVLFAGLSAGLFAHPAMADDTAELARLRSENAELKRELQSLHDQCPVPVAATPVSKPSVTAAPTAAAAATETTPVASEAAAPASALPEPPPPAAAPQPLPPAASSAAMPAPVAPPGYKLVKDTPSSEPIAPKGYKLVKEGPAYSQTGCTHGLFASLPDSPWRQQANWESLERGMSPAAVEKLLGVEHYNIASKTGPAWQYGRCAGNAQGTVYFEDDKVKIWVAPEW